MGRQANAKWFKRAIDAMNIPAMKARYDQMFRGKAKYHRNIIKLEREVTEYDKRTNS